MSFKILYSGAAAKKFPPGALGGDLKDLVAWAVGKELMTNRGSWRVRTVWGRKALT